MSNADLTTQLHNILQDYSKDVMNVVDECSEEVSKDAVKKLKTVKFKTGGEYSKSWAVKEEKGVLDSKTYIVYNRKHYRLTHLLEYGHVIRDGTGRKVGEAGAIEHIKPIEGWVQDQLPKDIINKLGGR